MIERVNGHVIDVYDDIADLPIDLFMEHNYYTQVDAGLGSDLSKVHSAFDPLREMIRRGDKQDAIQMTYNMQMPLLYAIERKHPQMMSYAALIKSVDGKVPESVEAAFEMLKKTRISYGLMRKLFEEVKKKLSSKKISTSEKAKALLFRSFI